MGKSKSFDFDSGGRAPCCLIGGPLAVSCEQDSCCVAVIATYPSDYCQWMLLAVFWLGLHRLQGSLSRLHGNMQSALASKPPSSVQCCCRCYCFAFVAIIRGRCWVCHKGCGKRISDGKVSMSLHPKTKLFEDCGSTTKECLQIFLNSIA